MEQQTTFCSVRDLEPGIKYMFEMWRNLALICLVIVVLAVLCVAPPVPKENAKEDEEPKGDPEYARYLKQVIEVLEEDDDYVQRLLNASEDELRTGKVAEDLDLVKHTVRTKLDELKRQEIERQRMIRRQMNDHLNGLKEREGWNPVFDDDNPNFFGPEDFKKLLKKVCMWPWTVRQFVANTMVFIWTSSWKRNYILHC